MFKTLSQKIIHSLMTGLSYEKRCDIKRMHVTYKVHQVGAIECIRPEITIEFVGECKPNYND